MYVEACGRCWRLSLTSLTCFNINSVWWYGWKALRLSFPKLFRIENPLSIKEVMSQNVCVCSFPIFDIFDIHSIAALRCIWSIFDIFDISDIHSITALRYIWSIFDIFDIDSITFKWYHIKESYDKNVSECSFPIFNIFDIQSITALRCIWSIFDIFNIDNIYIQRQLEWHLRHLWHVTYPVLFFNYNVDCNSKYLN